MMDLIANLQLYMETSSVLAFLLAYLAGVMVSFTPCIYPVIPITVAYIGTQSRGSKMRGFLLSIFYVLGTALTYTVLGLMAALSGSLFGNIQTSPWTFFIVANICILMGLSMLDVFMVQMPAFLMNLQPSGEQKGLAGSLLLGLASGLILGPCTAPVLGVLLTFVAARQNLIFGTSLLFVFALGMGTLLVLVGTFAGLVANLPKSGNWMIRVKRAFGWLMIALGEYFLIMAGRFTI